MLDFTEIKKQHSIEQVAERLGITLTPNGAQLRAACPCCGKDRSLVLTPAKNLGYCFHEQRGGDQLWLAQHVRKCTVREAAEWLATTLPKGEREDKAPKSQSFDRAKYKAALSREVEGVPKELCERADIGVSSKGALKGIVLPLYDQATGAFICYASVPSIQIPKKVR